jgi:hypothetical protein
MGHPKDKSVHYEPGEKDAVSQGSLWLLLKEDINYFDMIVCGFPPGKATIAITEAEGKTRLEPLIKEALRSVEVVPGADRRGLQEVHLYGLTDPVKGSMEDEKLRLARAKALEAFLRKLLPDRGLKPAIFAKAADRSKMRQFEGDSRLKREVARGVGIIFALPPLPPGCYAPHSGPSERETIEILRKVLNDPKAEWKLRKDELKFWRLAVALMAKKGDDLYVREDDVDQVVARYAGALRQLLPKLEKLSPDQREAYRKEFRAPPYPDTAFKQGIWRNHLATVILYKQQPELFKSPPAYSLLVEMRKLVKRKCGEAELIMNSLNIYLDQVRRGRASVSPGRNVAKAILGGLGVDTEALNNFFEIVVRDWIAAKEQKSNTLYGVLFQVFGKRRLSDSY